MMRMKRMAIFVATAMLCLGSAVAAPPEGKGNGNGNGNGNGGGGSTGGGGKATTLSTVKSKDWDEAHVRRVLRVFAYGGHASDAQIDAWAGMKADQAVAEILTFATNNSLLSPAEDDTAMHCDSLESLQDFWGSNDPGNPMRFDERDDHRSLGSNGELSERAMQITYSRAITTRGCNPFLFKTAFYLTNYHGSIHIRNAGRGLMRQYFDDTMAGLSSGADFVAVLTQAAGHGAVARAYRHQYNRIRSDGTLSGNEDFAREYFQLFFGILGTSGDPAYYEDVTIKNNGRLLTGMDIDRKVDLYGSDNSGDWYWGQLDFSDHLDETGRNLRNTYYHYLYGESGSSCLEILDTNVCGSNAGEKLVALGPIAAAHPESLANTPVKIVQFFADDEPTASKIDAIRGSWSEANFDLLAFLRAYAASTEFHAADTVKHFTAFDRNLTVYNAHYLTNEENFAMSFSFGPHYRMRDQGMEIFEPIRNVFGHQTGSDAKNDPFLFRSAYLENANNYLELSVSALNYTLTDGGEPQTWRKDWASLVPRDNQGRHMTPDVADWLWNRFVGDGGKNFDAIARAQVQSLLALGVDFAHAVDPDNPDPDVVFSSNDIEGANAEAAAAFQALSDTELDLASGSAGYRIGLAINFISMTPYVFAMEGQ